MPSLPPRPRLRLAASALFAVLVSAGCSRCGAGGGGQSGLLEHLPREAATVVVLPDLGSLGLKLQALQKLKLANVLAQLQGMGSAEEYLTSVFAGVGVDLRRPESLREAGIAPERGVGVVVLPNRQVYAVVGVEDADRFFTSVANLARNRLGATVRSTRAENGQSLVTFSQPGSHAAVVGVILNGRYAFVGTAEDVDRLKAAAALPSAASLAEDPALKAALQRLPSSRDAWVHVPRGGEGPGNLGKTGATFSATLAASGLTLQLDLPRDRPEDVRWLSASNAGPDLLPMLPPETALFGRFRGDPAALKPLWSAWVGPQVLSALQRSGFDVNTDVLDNLQPGAVVGLSLAPTASLGAGVPELDVRRTNPFRFVHGVALGAAKDDARVDATLEKLAAHGGPLGLKLEKTQLEGRTVFRSSYVQGEGASFAHFKERVVVAAPLAKLETALQALSAGTTAPVPEQVKAALDGDAVGIVVDLAKLAGQVKALPSEAWGVGGFAIKNSVVHWFEATDDLRALSLGLSPREGALEVRLVLRLSSP